MNEQAEKKVKAVLYDGKEFYEGLLRHLLRDAETMQQALNDKLEAEDFLASATSLNIYSTIAAIALEVGTAPIDPDTFMTHLASYIEAGVISDMHKDATLDICERLYAGDITPGSYSTLIKPFMRRRREEKAKLECTDTDSLREALNEIVMDLDKPVGCDITITSPFDVIELPEAQELIGTGFQKVDSVFGGLAYGQIGYVVGYTGSGKTAAGVMMCRNNAEAGRKVMYLSIEEEYRRLNARFYSNFFSLNYGPLRKGSRIELDQVWEEPDTVVKREIMKQNLRLIGLKGQEGLTADSLLQIMRKEYEKSGFEPDLIIVDQMQFLTAKTAKKTDESWHIEGKIAVELDKVSHQNIGTHGFVMWVQCQAKGAIKMKFTRQEIAGFKGIDNAADAMIGIGRENSTSNNFCMFSLKTRDSAPFEFYYTGELQYMRFIDTENQASDLLADEKAEYKKRTSKGKGKSENGSIGSVLMEEH